MNAIQPDDFSEITPLIAAARQWALQAVNTALIELYWQLAIREHWSKRELERQFKTALLERSVLNPPKVSPGIWPRPSLQKSSPHG